MGVAFRLMGITLDDGGLGTVHPINIVSPPTSWDVRLESYPEPNSVYYDGVINCYLNGMLINHSEVSHVITSGQERVTINNNTGEIKANANGHVEITCYYGPASATISLEVIGIQTSVYLPYNENNAQPICPTDIILDGTPEEYEIEVVFVPRSQQIYEFGERTSDPSPDGVWFGAEFNNISKTSILWSSMGNYKTQKSTDWIPFTDEDLEQLEKNPETGERSLFHTPFKFVWNKDGHTLSHSHTGYVFEHTDSTRRNTEDVAFIPITIPLYLHGRNTTESGSAKRGCRCATRVQYIKIRRNGELIHDFRPAIDWSSNYNTGYLRCAGFIDSLNSNLLYPFVHFLTGDEIMNNGNYPWLPIADLVTGYNPHKEDYGNCAEGYDDSIKINE